MCISNTSLFALLVLLSLSHSEWKSGGQDGAGGMYSPEQFFFPDSLLIRTSKSPWRMELMVQTLNAVESCSFTWWMPI